MLYALAGVFPDLSAGVPPRCVARQNKCQVSQGSSTSPPSPTARRQPGRSSSPLIENPERAGSPDARMIDACARGSLAGSLIGERKAPAAGDASRDDSVASPCPSLDRAPRLRAIVEPSRRAGLCLSLRAPLLAWGLALANIVRVGLGRGCQQEACAETRGEMD